MSRLGVSWCVIALVFSGCGDDNTGGDGGGGDAAAGGDMTQFCGNGVVDPGEKCDNGPGKNVHGSGCEPDCSFTCVPNGLPDCDDGDPCNGMETCVAQSHTCMKGTPLADGTACGTGKACKMGVCGDVTCGDKKVDPGEECDDGNTVNGDGCDNCKFSCVSTDNTRNCAPADPCAGQGTCNDTTHICAPGTPLADGTNCGAMNRYCKSGVCTQPVCGNGTVEPGEQCDNGVNNGPGTGCELQCVFSCANPMADCKGAPPVCELWSCTNVHVCAAIPDANQEGKACGANLICKNGACVGAQAVCGNGMVETGEQCDFGNGNGPGTGCEANCTFSCVIMPDSCKAGPCTGQPACMQVVVNGQTGQKCGVGAPLADGTTCGNMLICLGGACKLSACGDGFVDQGAGEQCEPPNTNTCDAQCHLKAVCGNGTRENGEQCDDGNTTNLDGCSATCTFEQSQRVDWLKMQFATDANCKVNALGGAVVSNLAQGPLQTALDNGIADGSITILFAMVGIKDLTGTNEPKLTIGVLDGTPKMPMGAPAYNGASDLDWWYGADAMALDNQRLPTQSLMGSIAAKVLTAGPGTVTLTISLGGMPAPLAMSGVTVKTTVGAVSTPLAAMNMLPPGHLPAEHLDGTLQSYATTGQQNANGAGNLCGNASAASLAKVPLPAMVVQNCNQYTAQNSLLDLLVGGCTAFGFIQLVKPTQPDQVDPGQPVAGAGGPYKLSASQGSTIDTCKDKNNQTVTLATCLAAAAYSSYFKLTSDRVIIQP